MKQEKFYFYTLEEKLPQENAPVLVKLNAEGRKNIGSGYYVFYMTHINPLADHPKIAFCEASGDEWMTIDSDLVDSWASIGEEVI